MPQKLLIEGDPFELMRNLAERYPGQYVSLVYEDGEYSVGVLDLADGDNHWFKGPELIAVETAEEPALSTDQRG